MQSYSFLSPSRAALPASSISSRCQLDKYSTSSAFNNSDQPRLEIYHLAQTSSSPKSYHSKGMHILFHFSIKFCSIFHVCNFKNYLESSFLQFQKRRMSIFPLYYNHFCKVLLTLINVLVINQNHVFVKSFCLGINTLNSEL